MSQHTAHGTTEIPPDKRNTIWQDDAQLVINEVKDTLLLYRASRCSRPERQRITMVHILRTSICGRSRSYYSLIPVKKSDREKFEGSNHARQGWANIHPECRSMGVVDCFSP